MATAKKKAVRKVKTSKASTSPLKAKDKKILWAIDPFVEGDVGLSVAAQAAQALSKTWDRPVEPVYILGPEGFQLPGDFSPAWIKSVMPTLEESLAKKVESVGMKDFLPPKILVNRSRGRRKEVKRLLSYARQFGSAPVVISTHGRSGMSRWLMGSFAETAILMARTPLLVVSPDDQVKDFKVALFPTHLSTKSKNFIRKQLPWLKKKNIKVVIYHKVSNPVDPFVQSGVTMAGGGWVSFQSLLQEDSLKMQREGDKFCKELTDKGIDAEFRMESTTGSLDEGVIDMAKKVNANLICLMSEADSLNANLVGSLARQLGRSSPCPLWIQHS